MNIFRKNRTKPETEQHVDDVLLRAFLGKESITCEQALNIPAVAQCVNLISETVSMIPIKLYREEISDGRVTPQDTSRTR